MEKIHFDFRRSVCIANHRPPILVTLSDLEHARLVQKQLLPRKLPCIPGWDLAVAYLPARVVSGDYCDVIDLGGDSVALVLGDVSGKGLGPALVMAGLRALIHSRLPQQRTNLEALMRELNLYLFATMPEDMFVSLFLAAMDVATGQLRYVNAGHIPPFLLAHSDDEPRRFAVGGPVLGILPDATFEEHQVKLESGNFLAVFSDGVTEATNGMGEMFQDHRVVKAFRKAWSRPILRSMATLLRSVERFTGKNQAADDISIILLKRLT